MRSLHARGRRVAWAVVTLLVASTVTGQLPASAGAGWMPGTGNSDHADFTPDAAGYKEAHFFFTPDRQPTVGAGGDGYFFAHEFGHMNQARTNQDGATTGGKGTGSVSSSPALDLRYAGVVVYAFVSTPAGGHVTLTDNRRLHWSRVNTSDPPQADTLVFRAPTPADGPMTGLVVTASSDLVPAPPVQLTVRAFNAFHGQDGAQVVASSPGGLDAKAGKPKVTITPTTTGSQIVGVAYDLTRATTVSVSPVVTPAKQMIDRQNTDPAAHSTMWTQHWIAPTTAGQSVTLAATPAPGTSRDAWVFFAMEILPEATTGYIGVQPANKMVIWAHWGAETVWVPPTPVDPNRTTANGCNGTADGAPGVHCWIAVDTNVDPPSPGYAFTTGHRYEVKAVISASADPTMQRETGYIRDVSAGTPFALIGWYEIPKYLGNFKLRDPAHDQYAYGFDEMFNKPSSCEEQEFARIRRDPPTAVNSTGGPAAGWFRDAYTSAEPCDTLSAAFLAEKDTNSSGPAITSNGAPRGAQLIGTTSVTGPGTQTTKPADLRVGKDLPLMLLAFVSTRANGHPDRTASISSPPTSEGTTLDWDWVARMDDPAGSGGSVEVWKAMVPRVDEPDRPSLGYRLTDLRVQSELVEGQDWDQTLTVQAYGNAAGTGTIVPASGKDGRPRATITPTRSQSTVASVGFDYSDARDVSPISPMLDTQATETGDNSTRWVQHQDAYTVKDMAMVTGVDLHLSGTATVPQDWWDMLSVEIVPPAPRAEIAGPMAEGYYPGPDGRVAETFPLTTALPDTLLVAFVSTEAGQTATVTSSGNPGTPEVTWTPVASHTNAATNGHVEVWTARAAIPLACFEGQPGVAPGPCLRVRSTLSGATPEVTQALFVTPVTNASSVVAATAAAGRGDAGVDVTPRSSGSLLMAVGADATGALYPLPPGAPPQPTSVWCSADACLDRAQWSPYPGARPGRTMWIQHDRRATTAGRLVSLEAAVDPNDQWTMQGVEIIPKV